MMVNLTLGVWGIASTPQRIKLSNINLQNTVEDLRDQVSKVMKNMPEDIELSYCGLILEDENKLLAYGITEGVTIHVIEKYQSKPQLKFISRMTTHELVNGFRTLIMFPNYRYALQRLTKPDVIDILSKICPKLYDDPAVIGLVQDPELIYYLSIPEHASEMIDKHPVLLNIASKILSLVREEQANLNPKTSCTSTGYSYSLEALSDDEEDIDLDEPFSQYPLTETTAFNGVTTEQLAAAIANAINAVNGDVNEAVELVLSMDDIE